METLFQIILIAVVGIFAVCSAFMRKDKNY